jgi:hypothetical protein
MKKLLLALALLSLPSAVLAQKTKAVLTTEINTNFANGTGITAATLRTTITDILNSYYDLNGGSSASCLAHQWVSALPTLSSITCTQPAIADVSGWGTGVATLLGGASSGTGGPLGSVSPTVTGSFTATGLVTNADLANSTISGTSLGSNLATLTFGTHLTGTSYNGSGAVTLGTDATNANTASTIVARDASGNFTAGTITAALTGHASLDAPLASPPLTGVPTTPTAAVNTNTTQIASTAYVIAQISGSTAGVAQLNTLTGTLTLLTEPQGRLTLQANTPVMNSNQTGISTLRYDAYIGNQVPYYTGTADALDTIASNEVTDAMVSAASAGQVVSGQVYDVWWVHGGANRICLAMSASTGGGGGWASDTAGSNTARGTGYSQIDRITRPYITNKNSITNCFNAATNYGPVSTNQGTYLGTIFATANGQTGMAFSVTAAGGGGNILGVYNAYNRVNAGASSFDSAASWSCTCTWRKADNNANNSISYIDGLGQSAAFGSYTVVLSSGGSAFTGGLGLSLDWTSGNPTYQAISFNNGSMSPTASGTFMPAIGLHVVNALEMGNGGTITFFGTGLGSGTSQTQYLNISVPM